MLTLSECQDLAAPHIKVFNEIWENDEAYYFEDFFGEWEDNNGIVVFKETGEIMHLYDYFADKKCWGIMKNFHLYAAPSERDIPKEWNEE